MNREEKECLDKRLNALSKQFQGDAPPDQDTLDMLDFDMEDEEEDAPEPLSWRRPKYTDWYIDIAGEVYPVHKSVLGDGTRKSGFFASNLGAQLNGTTKLDSLLPKACHGTIESTLDFFYEGKLDPQPATVLCFFKTAAVLKCKALFEASLKGIKMILGPETAPQFVVQSLSMMPGMEKVLEASIQMVAKQFDDYFEDHFEPLITFPHDVACRVLDHPALKCSDGSRAHFVSCYTAANQIAPESFATMAASMDAIGVDDALHLMQAACEQKDDELANKVVPVVALHFDRLSMPIRSNGYVQVPRLQVLCQLLKTDSLSVSTEDEVFDICVEYLTKNAGDLTDEQRKAIWSCCRFALLSPAALVEAQKNVGVQQFAQHEFELSLLARVLRLETDCEKLLSNLQETHAATPGEPPEFMRARVPCAPTWTREQFKISGNSAKLAWTGAGGTSYGYLVRVGPSGGDLREVFRGNDNKFTVNALDSGSDYIATVCALSSQGCESRVAELTFSTYDVPDGFRCYLDGEHRCGNLSVNKEGLEVNTETEGSILCELPLPQCGQAYWEVRVLAYDSRARPSCSIGVACRARDLKLWHYNSPEGWVVSMNGGGCTAKHHGRNLIRGLGSPIRAGTVWGLMADLEQGLIYGWQDGESLGVLFRGLELIEKRLYPALHVTAGVELGLQHVAKHEWPTPPGCGTMERISLNSSLKKSSQME